MDTRIILVPKISIHAPRVGSDSLVTEPAWLSINFNPRSPCGERLWHNIHLSIFCIFQSTLPVWGATATVLAAVPAAVISIHAPRVGSDRDSMRRFPHPSHFNPRSPCGERPSLSGSVVPLFLFQSTLPVWGATSSMYCNRSVV